jgi:23S rRNA pseudouridine1911/1915/1917 synthase
MELETYSGLVSEDHNGIRLDRYASLHLNLLSRSQIKTRLVTAKLNGKNVKLSRFVKSGDALELTWLSQVEENLEAQDIPLDILYEDSRVAVVNKKQGMVVHPGAGNYRNTLANALLFRRMQKTGEKGDGEQILSRGPRTGIVHRLDKDTSGVIITAYDDEALAILSDQFKARTIQKRYLAIVQGTPPETRGRISGRIFRDPRNRKLFTTGKDAGRSALSFYTVLKSWGAYSLLLVQPKTGRTHQIRVHLKSLGTPILGDPLYGRGDNRFKDAALMLHAWSLAIVLPGNVEASLFKAPVPNHMKVIIRCLNNMTQ